MSKSKDVKHLVDRRPQQSSPLGSRALRRAAARRAVAAASQPGSEARREFMKGVGVAGALLGLPGLALAGGGPGWPVGAGHSRGHPGHRRRGARHALFFNLSHLGAAATEHHLYLGGRKFQLVRVQDAPQVLAGERRRNAFLRQVPDDQITHHAVGVQAPASAVTLAYLTCNENQETGSWEMTGMYFSIPSSGLANAYRQARMLSPRGPLPLSAKRQQYGATPARTVADLRDEAALIDPNDFAAAVVGLHPDIVSVEPSSAAHIQTNYVSQDANTQFLGQLLATMGPAVPEGATGVTGMQPWATLQPLVDDDTGQPYKKSDGKLNQYYPDWSPEVEQNMAPAVVSIHPLVKDDPSLGIDVTAYNLNDPNDQPPPSQLAGTVWGRHDGIPTVEQPLATVPRAMPLFALRRHPPAQPPQASAPTVTFTKKSAETGLYVSSPEIGTAPDGTRTAVTLDNISNWFLRWLGVWVQFLDPLGDVIPASELPADTFPAGKGPYPRAGDKSDAIFLGVVPPAIAVCGVPVYPGQFAPTVYIPKSAASMRVLYTGAGLSGSPPKDPVGVYTGGAVMTVAFNYGVVGLFMAAGSSTYPTVFKLAVSLGGGALADLIATLIGGLIDQDSFAKGLLRFAMSFLKTLFQGGGPGLLAPVIAEIEVELGLAEAIDSVPVAGQIARAAAAVIGAVQLAETTLEIAASPAAYVFDLVQTHDLAVTFLPDRNASQFPQPPAGYSLYYKVSYLFDNGTAHTQPAVTLDPTVTSLPIKFTGIPYGGQVNISIGFYMRKSSTPPGQNDWCAGYATTGLTANTVEVVPPPSGLAGFPITEVKVPIQSTTRYVHTRKTALTAQGTHVWTTDPDGSHAPPYVPPPDAQQPGLGGFDAITVRQGTSQQQGYVGYAWKAFSSGVTGCGANAPGQFDQMANLNTDAGNGGANAQNGYVNSLGLCGFPSGVRIGYNLLTHQSLNLYLDTNTLLLRQVALDPPGFAGPASNQSFGMLNLDSTRCLVHPAGYMVSINNASHKIETLKLSATPVTDSVAATDFLARTCSGMGTRPGLIISPIALAISPDGVILVLEAGNNRIQAFDVGGNPVPYFKNQAQPYFLELDATQGYTYLDLAVEFSGYLYVLSANDIEQHRLDIYHPSQTGTQPICSTPDINASKLTVDFWRNVYTLNYEVLRLPDARIPEFTEPSVSLWVPPPPTP